ncbi:hypothetical protein SAMN04488012_11435 [Palleronia salina]|uniref:DUF6647 domain-containing protein n=1 Tax=Palleronia salina TaxID=313368 RepID=A0A1M6L515_9RHOB|nr:DUF6647 family protein [Palleronia salina]SHJ66276.1 hypothetical protein SAMN04488012_11435 [Palleronia salina]
MPALDRTRCRALILVLSLMLPLASAGAAPNLRFDPDPAWRHAEDLSALRETLEAWLDTHSDLPRNPDPLSISLVASGAAQALHGPAVRGHGKLRGLYDEDRGRVLLVAPWRQDRTLDASVLLHELVHHRQAGAHFYCPEAAELAAYRLQDQWLRGRGLEAPVNWIAVVIQAGCTPRDIHPD